MSRWRSLGGNPLAVPLSSACLLGKHLKQSEDQLNYSNLFFITITIDEMQTIYYN